MKRFNPTKAFKKLRAKSQRQKKAGAELARSKQEQWTASAQRSNIILQLNNLFPREGAGTLDVGHATKLMIEYAQTLSAKWVKARVKFVSNRLAKLAADGKFVLDADFKEILLNLLKFARAGDQAKVAEVFDEAMRGDPGDEESFRLCLVNWLADKVVDTWPPVPEELRPPVEASVEKSKGEGPLDMNSIMPAKEEWLPATIALNRAEGKGFKVNIKWLTQNSAKHGVGIRKLQQPGKYKKEVEMNSLARYLFKSGKLLKRAPPEEEEDEDAVRRRIQKANEKKRKERTLD
jgi:hypothetical protein